MPLLSVLRCMHVASTMQARGAALASFSQCGGGLAVWLPSSPFLPYVPAPGGPSVGGKHGASTL